MATIYEFLSIMALTYLFVFAEPSILIKRWIGFKDELYDSFPKSIQFIHRLIYCPLCSGFWIGLGFTQNIFDACIISVGSELLSRIINKLN